MKLLIISNKDQK